MLLIACLSVLGTGGYQSCPIRKEYWIEYFLIVIYKVFFRSHFSILASVLFIYVCALLHFCHSSLSLFFFVSVIICSLFQFYCLSFIFLIVPSLSSIICSTKLSSFGFLLLKFCPALTVEYATFFFLFFVWISNWVIGLSPLVLTLLHGACILWFKCLPSYALPTCSLHLPQLRIILNFFFGSPLVECSPNVITILYVILPLSSLLPGPFVILLPSSNS